MAGYEPSDKRYANRDALASVCVYLFAVAAGAAIAWTLSSLAVWRYSGIQGRYVLAPVQVVVWGLPGFFLGLAVAPGFQTWLQQQLFAGDYPGFLEYKLRLRSGDTPRALKYMQIMICVICLPLIWSGMNWCTIFSGDGITDQRPWPLSQRYHRYGDITGIVQTTSVGAPNGDVNHRYLARIRFNDGSGWSTDQQLSELDDDGKQALIAYVAQVSGKQPVTAPYLVY